MLLSQAKAAFSYRHFIVAAVRGEFKSRVARSRIGMLWFVLHPLAMALIYVLILSEVLGAKLGNIDKTGGYAVYLLAGVAVWTLFSEILNRCIGIFIEYSSALKKINFPRICLPFIVIGGAVITHLILLIAIMAIIAFFGFYPTYNWIFLIPVLLIAVILAAGLGILLGVMNVFARDVAQVMQVIMNMWFWLTPIVYTLDIVPESIRAYIYINPATSIVSGYQQVIVYEQMPDWQSLAYPASLAVILFALSLFVFRRAAPELVDAL